MTESSAQVIQEEEQTDYDLKLHCDIRLLVAYGKLGTTTVYSLGDIMEIADIPRTPQNIKRISAQLIRMTALNMFTHGNSGYTAQYASLSSWIATVEGKRNPKLRKTFISIQENRGQPENLVADEITA